MKKRLSIALAMSLLVSGCASTGNHALGEMDAQQVASTIQNGITTKAELVAGLGNPNSVDLLADGREKWTYSHSKSVAKAINFIPIASAFQRGTNDTNSSLIVLFDDNGVVSKHAYSNSKGETKVGLIG